MVQWAVTANLAGAHASTAVKRAMTGWAQTALARNPAFVFAQEVPSDDWLALWGDAGYSVFCGEDRGWTVRSALLVREGVKAEPVDGLDAACGDRRAVGTAAEFPTLHYHGSYVAAGRWQSAHGEILLASVHASPNEAGPSRYGWTGPEVRPRNGGGDRRYRPDWLWDSDMLLETLAGMACVAPVLAAGDLNEAVGFDFDESGRKLGSWGREFFDRARARELVPWLSDAWGAERPTRGRLQLDHVLQSRRTGGLLLTEPEPHLDEQWAAPRGADLSDHTPVWFAVNPEWF